MLISTSTREGQGVGRLRDEDGKLVLRYGWTDYEVQVARQALALVHEGKTIVGAVRRDDGNWRAWEHGGDVHHDERNGIEAMVGVLRLIV